ncbi:hypothetical protein ACGFX2_35005 [Streptomyces goshikiensis]|uniref:hypothetical protein n=1 Tax=Streptomyces goshikiensis TaxID=1942 RepID=UPI0037215B46
MIAVNGTVLVHPNTAMSHTSLTRSVSGVLFNRPSVTCAARIIVACSRPNPTASGAVNCSNVVTCRVRIRS